MVLTSKDIPYGGHVKFHIFNQPITNKPTKSLCMKTEYTPRTVVPLVIIFNCLPYDSTVHDKWKVTWQLTLNRMLLSMKGYMTLTLNRMLLDVSKWKVTWQLTLNRMLLSMKGYMTIDPKQDVIINERLHDNSP